MNCRCCSELSQLPPQEIISGRGKLPAAAANNQRWQGIQQYIILIKIILNKSIWSRGKTPVSCHLHWYICVEMPQLRWNAVVVVNCRSYGELPYLRWIAAFAVNFRICKELLQLRWLATFTLNCRNCSEMPQLRWNAAVAVNSVYFIYSCSKSPAGNHP